MTGLAGPRRRRHWVAAIVVIVVVAVGVGVAAAAGAFGTNGTAAAGTSNNGYQTSAFTVQRESLTQQTQENATLADAGSYTVVVPQSSASSSSSASSPSSSSSSAPGAGAGTFTWLPQVGQTVREGHEIYAVSGSPVVLLYGSVPAYRDLYEGLTGADVTELNTDLVKLGYATAAALGPRSGWDYYSAETAYAVGQLQARFGLTVTGELSLGEAAFLPGPALVTGLGTGVAPGSAATPGAAVLTATSTTPAVSIPLDAGDEGLVKVGDAVSVTLPDGSTTPGKVSQIITVASSSSSASNGSSSGSPGQGNPGSGSSGTGSSGSGTITVLVSLDHPKAAGNLNQAPVTVTITTGSVSNVLVVPVDALLAQPGGGYAVEVTGPHGHHLVKVTPGMFDDAAGLVQVTGNLTPGQHVVVPGI